MKVQVFWRISFISERELAKITGNTRFRFPEDLIDSSLILKNMKTITIGHGLILATLDLNLRAGIIKAIGVVKEKENVTGMITVEWSKANHIVYPSPSGIGHWKKRPIFKFPSYKAEEYRLADLFNKMG
jgi:hypothetical protein